MRKAPDGAFLLWRYFAVPPPFADGGMTGIEFGLGSGAGIGRQHCYVRIDAAFE